MSQRVFVTRAVPDAATELLREGLNGAKIDVNPHDRNLSPGELSDQAEGSDALICTLADIIDEPLLRKLSPQLKVVATYAVGVNNIDLEAARALGIAVCNTPDVLTDATAEVAVGLILACMRRIAEGDRLTRDGGFVGWAPLLHLGHGVHNRVLGIVGAGRIGQRVADIMRKAFGCRVVYSSRSPKPGFEGRHVELEELLRVSDIVSLHCPLTPETHHLINAGRIALMKPSAVLINTARGPVVDEAALVEALAGGRLFAAGLDVYEHEPALSSGLAQLENVVLLPHIGSATHETRDEMGRMCARAVVDVLSGRDPRHRVA